MYVHLTPRRGRRELFFDFRFRERAGRRGERFPGCNRSVCASRRRRASLSFSFLFLSVSAGDVFRQDSATFPSELWSYFSPSLFTCSLVNQSAGWGKKKHELYTIHSSRHMYSTFPASQGTKCSPPGGQREAPCHVTRACATQIDPPPPSPSFSPAPPPEPDRVQFPDRGADGKTLAADWTHWVIGSETEEVPFSEDRAPGTLLRVDITLKCKLVWRACRQGWLLPAAAV